MKRTFIVAAMVMLAQLLMAQNLADLFENNKRSVVTLYVAESVSTGTGDPRTFVSSMGLGSGVLIRDDMALTAAHVVGNAEEIMVQFFNGESISAKTVRISKNADVALIQLNKIPNDPQVAVLGNSDETIIGEEVFVVIGARFKGQWIFVRHKERSIWEMPAGHIENDESADQAAVRELFEEAGVIRSSLDHIHDYSVTVEGHTGYGTLYAATVLELESKLEHEIVELQFSDELPPELTYPEVQTILFNRLNAYFQLTS